MKESKSRKEYQSPVGFALSDQKVVDRSMQDSGHVDNFSKASTFI